MFRNQSSGFVLADRPQKTPCFSPGFDGFDIDRVAAFSEAREQQLCNNAAIIRNRLKIKAVIYNAQVLQNMLQEHGSFLQLLQYQQQFHQLDLQAWVKWFRQNFRFVGGEIVNEFLMSASFLPSAHKPNCPVYAEILKCQPEWLKYQQPLQP